MISSLANDEKGKRVGGRIIAFSLTILFLLIVFAFAINHICSNYNNSFCNYFYLSTNTTAGTEEDNENQGDSTIVIPVPVPVPVPEPKNDSITKLEVDKRNPNITFKYIDHDRDSIFENLEISFYKRKLEFIRCYGNLVSPYLNLPVFYISKFPLSNSLIRKICEVGNLGNQFQSGEIHLNNGNWFAAAELLNCEIPNEHELNHSINGNFISVKDSLIFCTAHGPHDPKTPAEMYPFLLDRNKRIVMPRYTLSPFKGSVYFVFRNAQP